MATPAQILANRSNAEASTGPVTPEGKAIVSRNATKLGLFSAAAFVRPEEQPVFEDFSQRFIAELRPESSVEHTLVREIIHAAWRLRRCADLELEFPQDSTPEDLDRLQSTIDRARTTAQRTLHRMLAELRRLRSDRAASESAQAATRAGVVRGSKWNTERPLSACAEIERQLREGLAALERNEIPDSAEQSQIERVAIPSIARNAPCPCGSREKYKRCCGKSAPPVLGQTYPLSSY